jgi:hypothetical protein
MQFVDLRPLFSRRTVTLESLLNRVQQILVPKWLRQEFYGTRFQRPYGHRNVSVRRNKDNGYLHTNLGQPALEIEPTHLRKSYIQNQATRVRGGLPAQKLLTGCKRLGAETD